MIPQNSGYLPTSKSTILDPSKQGFTMDVDSAKDIDGRSYLMKQKPTYSHQHSKSQPFYNIGPTQLATTPFQVPVQNIVNYATNNNNNNPLSNSFVSQTRSKTPERDYMNSDMANIMLTTELERLRGEVEAWKQRYQGLDKIIMERQGSDVELQSLRQKYTNLSLENEKLRILIAQQQEEFGVQKNKQVQNKTSEIEYKLRYETALREIEDWQKRYQMIELNFAEYRQNQQQYANKDFENKIQFFQGENDRLKSLLAMRDSDFEKLSASLRSKDLEVAELRNRLEELVDHTEREKRSGKNQKNQLDIMAQALLDKDRQIDEMRSKLSLLDNYSKYEYLYGEAQQKSLIITQELEKLNLTLSKKILEVEEYQKKVSTLEGLLRGRDASNYQLEEKIRYLVQEVEALRARLQESERDRLGLQINQEKLRELIAIVEIKQREIDELRINQQNLENYRSQFQNFESKILVLTDELQNITAALKSKSYEADEYKKKITTLELQLSAQFQRVRDLQQNEDRIIILSQEIEGLRRQLSDRDSELRQLRLVIEEQESHKEREKRSGAQHKNRVAELQEILEFKQKELEEYKLKVLALEAQFTQFKNLEASNLMYRQDIDRLNQDLRLKLMEIDEWKLRYATFEKSNSQKILSLQASLDQLTELHRNKTKELEASYQQIKQLEYSLQQNELRAKDFKQYETRILLLSQDNETLRRQFLEKVAEIESLQLQLQEEQNHKEKAKRSGAQVQGQVQQLSIQLEQANLQIEEWMKKYSQLEQQLLGLRSFELKAREYEEKVVVLAKEIENLNKLVSSSFEEISVWKAKYSQIEKAYYEARAFESKYGEAEQRLNLYLGEIEEWRSRYASIERELSISKSDLYQFKKVEEKIIFYQQEIERLNTLIRNRDSEMDSWRARYSEVEAQLAIAKQDIFTLKGYQEKFLALSQEIEQYRYTIAKLEANENEARLYENKYREQERIIVLLTQDIGNYRVQIDSYLKEIQECRAQLEEQNNQKEREKRSGQINKNEIMRLTEAISLREREIDELRSRLVRSEQQINDFKLNESKYSNVLLELDQWKSRYLQIEGQLSEFRFSEQKILQLQDKLSASIKETERLGTLLRLKSEEIQKYELKYTEYRLIEEKNNALVSEIDRLNIVHSSDQQELYQWRSQYVESGYLKKRSQELLTLMVLLFVEIDSLRARLRSKDNELNEARKSSLASFKY